MDVTFITIHGKSGCLQDLSRDASILYASDSIQVVLGYQPQEVLNRSCWDYFHPKELQFARSVHGRGVRLDKAAVLNYCSIRHKNGSWVGCECVFTVVYDVLIASTTIYGQGRGSQKRAIDAPIVRQLFDSSPHDPRYHMLTLLSDKFSRRLAEPLHEPRAALFVNRFTRTATIMYATSGVTEILGLQPHQLVSKSFFYCIQERCLRDAVRCLESAKANDSIAYLRFWFRNPLLDEDVDMDTGGHADPASGTNNEFSARAGPPIELEAVVSCTSDGLVPVPVYSNGIFAAPWALEPVYAYGTASYPADGCVNTAYPEAKTTLCRENEISPLGLGATIAPTQNYSSRQLPHPAASTKTGLTRGPQENLLMDTIRDVAVFAWGIVGINRSLEQHKYGSPSGNAHPDVTMDETWEL
ncbi:hypothetical protein N7539_005250 [Penicillium diatomitis]|uniref:PAS domain-containing protein n=1 Tax=Penicillium diatomitis TaxID=2819901 RepID=A0A9W9X6M9_9EURO|nr:uncharacterized protein N7539_005250 [Penicillium diatomitis]KAJ5485262.1 hypothetical protein N7539_005250 [Penicillium diatomitis]